MPNRHSRDKLINIALNIAQLDNLVVHDCPHGVVQSDAFSLQWLQDILDFWYHMVPFSSTVVQAQLNATANQDYIILPEDFIVDVRHGYLVETIPGDPLTMQRRLRLPFQRFLSRSIGNQRSSNGNFPTHYCVNGRNAEDRQLLRITPTPTIATVGAIWYYQMPPLLSAGDKPAFPSDYVIVEYIRIRALEWARILEPGTAVTFCDKIIKAMKANGLMNEPEDDEISNDETRYPVTSSDGLEAYRWMGHI